jgi:hypothetical protein
MVNYLKNSNQKQRWLATSLLAIEPRRYRICGCKRLPQLRREVQRELQSILRMLASLVQARNFSTDWLTSVAQTGFPGMLDQLQTATPDPASRLDIPP